MATVPHNRGIDEVCAELEKMFDAGEKAALLGAVRHLLGSALGQVDQLSARVGELLHQLYGRKSERLNPNQLKLALAELQDESEPDQPAVPSPPSEGEPRLRPKDTDKAKKRGRKPLPPDLPREEIRVVPSTDQLAAISGKMTLVGEQKSEVLEYEPAQFKVLVYMREVWSNDEGQIVTAPVPDKVIDKGLPGPGLLVMNPNVLPQISPESQQAAARAERGAGALGPA